MITKNVSWSTFKTFVADRGLKVNFFEDSKSYEIYATDDFLVANCNLSKKTSDALEFENTLKIKSNRRLSDNIGRLDRIITIIENLKDGANKYMNVDGSVVNKIYSYSPGSGEALVDGIICLFDDPGAATFSRFGSTAALTNGIIFSVIINGATVNLTTIKDNGDMVTRFSRSFFGNSASDALGGAAGFGESYDVFYGYLSFVTPILLIGADAIKVTIQDSLFGISTLQMACVIRKGI